VKHETLIKFKAFNPFKVFDPPKLYA